MCDIWKGNKNLQQLTEKDVTGLLHTLETLGTRQVVMSGGEALLNGRFFQLCELLKNRGMHITLLSTGLSLLKNAQELVKLTNETIISLDGDEILHDKIRGIPGAFQKMKEGVQFLRHFQPAYRITARTVIHKLNYRKWPEIIDTARNLGLNQVSFLAADISSQAFNREIRWTEERQNEVLPTIHEIAEMQWVLKHLLKKMETAFSSGFIAESPQKLQKIIDYYKACHGLMEFPYKKCNAPWVSAVIEASGDVRPCFFHKKMGNIKETPFHTILNSEENIRFRKELNIQENDTCKKCVCSLNLSPMTALA
jgi:MoaA/NifB/PqqE/SkfB family radical SAM enzyme